MSTHLGAPRDRLKLVDEGMIYKTASLLFAASIFVGCPTETPKPVAQQAPPPKSIAPQPTKPAVAPKPATPKPAIPPPATGTAMKVADVFAQKDTLGAKGIALTGKVVKFNANIMGANWLHIQDGSGADGTNDIVVTTKTVVAVGDTVDVVGRLSRSRDFGMGYKFDVILENARVTKK